MANYIPFKTTRSRCNYFVTILSGIILICILLNSNVVEARDLPPTERIFATTLLAGDVNDIQKLTPPTDGEYTITNIDSIGFRNLHTPPRCDDTTTHKKIKNTFSVVDYVVVVAMLVISCGIGLFYGFIGKKQTSSSDFLLGGSSMGTIPTALSLAASFITAIELLGNPAEMYKYGAQYWMICVAFILIIPFVSRLYLPVFMQLRLTSSYEYLSLRFNNSTRYLASGLYILQMVLYTSVAVYAPALALSNVTGLNVYVAVSMVYIVCIFYASQGGMKAVIIADSFQTAVLIGSLLAILTLGEYYLGGSGIIWSTSYQTERLQIFDMNPNPTVRHTFWSVVIGGTFYWLTMFCANQASIQKYLSVKSLSQARTAIWVSSFGLIFIYTINFYTGMIMLANWKDCDPIKSGDISTSDELLPLYVINILGHLQGMTGFFVAGIFAASLGTVASALNSLAAVTTEDFIQGVFKIQLPASKGAFVAKWISFVYGVLSFGLVFIVEQLGSVMQVALSFNGMVGGVTLGLFSLGMFVPWANAKGALLGATVAAALVLTMGIGSQFMQANGAIVIPSKYTSTEYCECFNHTGNIIPEVIHVDESDVFFLFRISYLWYSMIGCLTTIILGTLTSFCTGLQSPKELNPDLLSPAITDLFSRFSNDMKDFLNLPLKNVQTQQQKNLSGVVNPTLDMSDEKPIPPVITDRKISIDKIRPTESYTVHL